MAQLSARPKCWMQSGDTSETKEKTIPEQPIVIKE